MLRQGHKITESARLENTSRITESSPSPSHCPLPASLQTMTPSGPFQPRPFCILQSGPQHRGWDVNCSGMKFHLCPLAAHPTPSNAPLVPLLSSPRFLRSPLRTVSHLLPALTS